jgi:hypothetical protein
VISLSFRPQLTATASGASVIWKSPTNYAGFDYIRYTLQSNTDLAPTVVWVTHFHSPVIVNGQDTVTNPLSGAQQFYRFSR